MRIDVLTLFPNAFSSIDISLMKKAKDNNMVNINYIDFRKFSTFKNKNVDDTPCGGGAGQVICVQPVVDCLRSIPNYEKAYKIITAPRGSTYNQNKCVSLSKYEHIIILCGRYDGFDERIYDYFDESISIGNFILSGGELVACVIIDSVVRLINGVIGNSVSLVNESFENDLLSHPIYTRPIDFEGKNVPKILLSGNHEKINEYRKQQAKILTMKHRKDLLKL